MLLHVILIHNTSTLTNYMIIWFESVRHAILLQKRLKERTLIYNI
jgi:hypothetical protein